MSATIYAWCSKRHLRFILEDIGIVSLCSWGRPLRPELDGPQPLHPMSTQKGVPRVQRSTFFFAFFVQLQYQPNRPTRLKRKWYESSRACASRCRNSLHSSPAAPLYLHLVWKEHEHLTMSKSLWTKVNAIHIQLSRNGFRQSRQNAWRFYDMAMIEPISSAPCLDFSAWNWSRKPREFSEAIISACFVEIVVTSDRETLDSSVKRSFLLALCKQKWIL